jgi:hypothetical protein
LLGLYSGDRTHYSAALADDALSFPAQNKTP